MKGKREVKTVIRKQMERVLVGREMSGVNYNLFPYFFHLSLHLQMGLFT